MPEGCMINLEMRQREKLCLLSMAALCVGLSIREWRKINALIIRGEDMPVRQDIYECSADQ